MGKIRGLNQYLCHILYEHLFFLNQHMKFIAVMTRMISTVEAPKCVPIMMLVQAINIYENSLKDGEGKYVTNHSCKAETICEGIEYLAKRQHFKTSSDTDAFLFQIVWFPYRDNLIGDTDLWAIISTYICSNLSSHNSPYHKHLLHSKQAL